MNHNFKASVALLSLSALLSSCAAGQARQAIADQQRQVGMNNEAWMAARQRLHGMCPQAPQSVEEYQRRKLAIRAGGGDSLGGCDARLVKLTNAPRFDDWDWDWLPSYQTIVAVHDEELRKRVVPKVYDEYILGLGRYLAAKADRGEITPQQLMMAFNEAWRWMFGKMREEAILLQQNLVAAQLQDAATINALTGIAVGLASVASAALQVRAETIAASYRAAPVNCTARQVGAFVNVTCY